MLPGSRKGFPAPVRAAAGGATRPNPLFLHLLDDEGVLFFLRFGIRVGAGSLGIPERTLRRRFEERGLRLADLLEARRRDETLRLLSGGLPVASIALRLGFSSAQTFARYMRREFGSTASGLRKRLHDGESGPFGRYGHLWPPPTP
jgi:AraC-like DNA-binding protein